MLLRDNAEVKTKPWLLSISSQDPRKCILIILNEFVKLINIKGRTIYKSFTEIIVTCIKPHGDMLI